MSDLFRALGRVAAESNKMQAARLQRHESRQQPYSFLPEEPVIDWDGMQARLEAAQRDIDEALRKMTGGAA